MGIRRGRWNTSRTPGLHPYLVSEVEGRANRPRETSHRQDPAGRRSSSPELCAYRSSASLTSRPSDIPTTAVQRVLSADRLARHFADLRALRRRSEIDRLLLRPEEAPRVVVDLRNTVGARCLHELAAHVIFDLVTPAHRVDRGDDAAGFSMRRIERPSSSRYSTRRMWPSGSVSVSTRPSVSRVHVYVWPS